MTQIEKLKLQKIEFSAELETLTKKIRRLNQRAKQIKEKLLPSLDEDIKNLTELKETVPRSELESTKILKEIQETGSHLFTEDHKSSKK